MTVDNARGEEPGGRVILEADSIAHVSSGSFTRSRDFYDLASP